MKSKESTHNYFHLLIAGIIVILVVVFSLRGGFRLTTITGVVIMVALSHFIIAGILVIFGYLIFPKRLKYKIFSKRRLAKRNQKLYFGWSTGWTNLYWIASITSIAGSVYFYKLSQTNIWVSFILFIVSINLIIGYILLQSSLKKGDMTLPLVDLTNSDNDLILDAGCGSGRTTIALAKVMKRSKIIALDKFDSYYIEDGGRGLIERNLALLHLNEQVEIVNGNITDLKFADNYFDSAISSYMIDHLGSNKLAGLKEVQRVLKPGGKFLLIVFVPNWTTFAVFSFICFGLTTRNGWRKLLKASRFSLLEEGFINGGEYFLIEKQTIKTN